MEQRAKTSAPVAELPRQSRASIDLREWDMGEKDALVLNYTLACPLSCDFCCYECGPQRKEKMPLELALKLVNQLPEVPRISCVGFTGGEPMLFHQELLKISARLRQLDYPFTMVTSGYWGGLKRIADHVIGELADNGLTRANISFDPSHEKFVSRDQVAKSAAAFVRRGIKTYLVGTFYDPELTVESVAPELANIDGVSVVNKYVAKVGRAVDQPISLSGYGLDLDVKETCCYRRIYHDIVVFWDGKVYPCCSTFNRATTGISVGNANDLSLVDIWERVEGSLLFRILKRQGFSRLFDLIEDTDPVLYGDLPDVSGCVGPCSLCNTLFGDEALASRIHRAVSLYEDKKIESAVDFLVQKIGQDAARQTLENFVLSKEVESSIWESNND